MKSYSITRSGKVLATLSAVTLGMGIFALRAQADQWDKKTVLTVHEPIQVRDRVLDPGTYVFKLADSNSDRHIVQIFNDDQSHIIDTILAIPNYRLRPSGDSRFSFWETPPGTTKALRAWFYPGDNFGQEFPYPKQLAMLAQPVVAPVPAPAPEPVPETPSAMPAPAPEPEQSMTQHEPQQEQPVEMAQSNPPDQQPEAAAPAEAPTKLPKTATMYPLFGLGGLASIGIYALLRLKRMV